MSKTRQKLNKLKRKEVSSDVTLNDFANSNVASGCGRLRKKAIHDVTAEVKLLNVAEDDRAWDEKLEDLMGMEEYDCSKKSGRRKKKMVSEGDMDYPIDIWYQISEYLAPEDIGTFAAICRTSYAVINSAAFWFSLYKRFYREVEGMPEVLQPVCMVRRYGLRALAIRSLYFTYPPFIHRCQTRYESDPRKLLGMRCVISWSQKLKGREQWMYTFKMKENKASSHGRKKDKAKPDLLEMLDDIHANVDDGCKILQVKGSRYCPLPMITGQTLLDCSIAIEKASNFGSYCLLMQFGIGPSTYQACPISINGLASTRVLDWWHPAFSHGEQLHSGLFNRQLLTEYDFS